MKGKFKQQSFGSLLQDEEYAAFQWLKLPGRALSAGSGRKAEPCPACRDPGAAWPWLPTMGNSRFIPGMSREGPPSLCCSVSPG